jgi:uncharacterized membrane protein YdbT with pleckstrin-like domain
MNRDKIENVDVDQSLLGRIFGYGTVLVRGTGGSLEPINNIGDLLTFALISPRALQLIIEIIRSVPGLAGDSRPSLAAYEVARRRQVRTRFRRFALCRCFHRDHTSA